MTKQRIRYYSSPEFEKLVKELRTNFNIGNKSQFFERLFQGHTFTLKQEKATLYGRLFNSLESQVHSIDSKFISRTSKEKLNQSNLYQADQAQTIQELINNIHIEGIEDLPVKEYGSLRFTENGEFGLTIYSKQFCDCYLRILQETIVMFDFEIATVKPVNLNTRSPFIKELRTNLKELSDNNAKQDGYRKRGLKRNELNLVDNVAFQKAIAEHLVLSDDEISGLYNKHNELITVLTETTRSLDSLTSNRKNAMYCRKQIANLMSEITNTDKLDVRTEVDYLIHLLSNINVVNYEADKEALPTIKAFSSNMEKLNTQIREYHELAKSKKATAKALYQKAALVKYQLRVTAIKNYNLVKEFQSSN
ncbi:TPA: hypothetical protein NG682_000999 [Vibrio parahaemolyticus]|nr:hypothetical protein [Vibrio parahaemolyticus]